jgi:hypothetical protein
LGPVLPAWPRFVPWHWAHSLIVSASLRLSIRILAPALLSASILRICDSVSWVQHPAREGVLALSSGSCPQRPSLSWPRTSNAHCARWVTWRELVPWSVKRLLGDRLVIWCPPLPSTSRHIQRRSLSHNMNSTELPIETPRSVPIAGPLDAKPRTAAMESLEDILYGSVRALTA